MVFMCFDSFFHGTSRQSDKNNEAGGGGGGGGGYAKMDQHPIHRSLCRSIPKENSINSWSDRTRIGSRLFYLYHLSYSVSG